MDFDVLPGPPLAELARTTMDRARAAVIGYAGSRNLPLGTVPLRASPTGHPILLPRHGSVLDRHLAASSAEVTVTVPADAPFSALRLTGMTRPDEQHDADAAGHGAGHGAGPGRAEPAVYAVTVQSLEFTGAIPAPVALHQYETAAPDPLRHCAPEVLGHLEHCHMAELVSCVRAHGITAAECVVPRGLDRFGLELLVFTPGGLAAVRLAFPAGPVTAMEEIPVSIRSVLTCRCAGPAQPHRHHPVR
jgi:hypothetical protein